MDAERRQASALDTQWHRALSHLRVAVASGMWADTDAALHVLSTPPTPRSSELWFRLHDHLGRAFILLQSQHKLAQAVGISAGDLSNVTATLLWAAECLLADAEASSWFPKWEEEWRSSVPQRLHAYLDADAATFRAWLEEARRPLGSRMPAGEPALAEETTCADSENELLQAFFAEMDEGLRRAEELLLQLERAPNDASLLHALFRQYHTLKGAAGAVDLHAAAEQLHQGESLLQALRDGELELPTPAVVDFFLRLGDSVRAMIEEACGHEPTTEKMENLDDAIAALLQSESSVASAPHPPSGSAPAPLPNAAPSSSIAPAATGANTTVPHLQALREKAAKGQLDPELLAMIEALEQRAEFFASMAASLQAEVQELRTVPAEDLFRRLARPLRDAARHEGKQVRLETSGGEVRIPKDLAEPLAEILLHLVRNAVAHGIERTEQRRQQGKPTHGTVRVSVQREEAMLRIAVADDGRGIDYDAVRRKAIALGWLAADAAQDPRTLESFLFRPGFSTRGTADALAGRGVGMDVVASAVEKFNGRLGIRSVTGRGTTVEVLLPLESSGGL